MLYGTLTTGHDDINDTSKFAALSCRKQIRTKNNTSIRNDCSKGNERTNRNHKTRVDRTMFKVSTRERNRVDLDSLRSKVDARLATLQARPGAICVVREQVFSELFDELIRGVSATRWRPSLLSIVLCTSNRLLIPGACHRWEDPIVYCNRLGAPQSLPTGLSSDIIDTFLDIIAYVWLHNNLRQITLECPERGLLLLRLRDEARMKLETYNEIYR